MHKIETIYASYGVLGHENEVVWGITPAADAPAYDEVRVELPDGYVFEENDVGEPLVEAADGTAARLAEILATATVRDDKPFLYFPKHYTWCKVPLTVIDANGD